jgi:hypothetical protein
MKGEFEDIRRHGIGKGKEHLRACYMGMRGRVTLQELIDHLAIVAPEHALSEFKVNFATVTWEDQATEEELQVQRENDRKNRERHERWEREYYERLKEKYGS